MPLTPGTRLGPYEITDVVGAGGMGEVYRARDTRLDRDVAIKVLPDTFAADPDRLSRFEREARAVAALSHPGILAIHDFGRADGLTYAVMELLEGSTLRARLDSAPLAPRRAIDVAGQIVRALGAAHEKGIVHRDIKPENIFITTDGHVKILDFGLARLAASPIGTLAAAGTRTRVETGDGVVLGTVGYMSPEQVRGVAADHRSDIFSFGVVLYEMLTGRRPFAGGTAVETMNAILKEDPPAMIVSDAAIAPTLSRLVAHALEKEPAERFQSARDLAFSLEALRASFGYRRQHGRFRSIPPPPSAGRGSKHCRRRADGWSPRRPDAVARRGRRRTQFPHVHTTDLRQRYDLERPVCAGWSDRCLRCRMGRRPHPHAAFAHRSSRIDTAQFCGCVAPVDVADRRAGDLSRTRVRRLDG